MAKSSLEELRYQTFLSLELVYIQQEDYNLLFNLEEEVGKLLNGWIKSQK